MLILFRLRICAAVLVGGALLLCSCIKDLYVSDPFVHADRPFRLGTLTLSPLLESEKPLAMADYAGFVVSGTRVIGATESGWLRCFDLKTGETYWWQKLDARSVMPLAVLADAVIVGLSDGMLLKIEIVTGKLLWKVELDTQSQRRPILAGSTLIVQTAGQQVHAMDFVDGKVKWVYDPGFPDGLELQGVASPLLAGDLVVVGLNKGELHGLRLSSGELLWKHLPVLNTTGFKSFMGEMYFRGGIVVVARYDGFLGSIQLIDGKQPQKGWEETLPAIATITERSGRIYVGCVNGEVHAFEISTGKKLWTTPLYQTISTIMPGDQAIYLTSSNGFVASLATADGSVRWYDLLEGDIVARPFIHEEGMYFATGIKNIYGYKF